MEPVVLVVKSLVYTALVIGAAYLLHKALGKGIKEPEGSSYRTQLLTLGIALGALIVLLVVLPFNETLRGQLLSLTGILLSAVIALSSTTFVGNVMAGAMLRSIKHCSPGDYVEIGDYFGRISEMDLLHVEIQTEDRDLVTLPNMFAVTNPMKVLRPSGTFVSAMLSLGYDVDRKSIEKNLLNAANDVGLDQSFVHIKELGDFSVTYRISGLLTDLSTLLSTRSRLRAKVMDHLHDAGIEIVSPTFMNQRQYQTDQTFMPAKVMGTHDEQEEMASEAVIFDKADKAESLKQVKDQHTKLLDNIKELEERKKGADDKETALLQQQIDQLTKEASQTEEVVSEQQENLQEED